MCQDYQAVTNYQSLWLLSDVSKLSNSQAVGYFRTTKLWVFLTIWVIECAKTIKQSLTIKLSGSWVTYYQTLDNLSYWMCQLEDYQAVMYYQTLWLLSDVLSNSLSGSWTIWVIECAKTIKQTRTIKLRPRLSGSWTIWLSELLNVPRLSSNHILSNSLAPEWPTIKLSGFLTIWVIEDY